jgi:hypothetical protein
MTEAEFDKTRILPSPHNPYIQFYVSETTTNRDAGRSAQFLQKIFKFNFVQENLTFFEFLHKYFGEFLQRLMKKSVR